MSTHNKWAKFRLDNFCDCGSNSKKYAVDEKLIRTIDSYTMLVEVFLSALAECRIADDV